MPTGRDLQADVAPAEPMTEISTTPVEDTPVLSYAMPSTPCWRGPLLDSIQGLFLAGIGLSAIVFSFIGWVQPSSVIFLSWMQASIMWIVIRFRQQPAVSSPARWVLMLTFGFLNNALVVAVLGVIFVKYPALRPREGLREQLRTLIVFAGPLLLLTPLLVIAITDKRGSADQG